jgi:hypothetical protein
MLPTLRGSLRSHLRVRKFNALGCAVTRIGIFTSRAFQLIIQRMRYRATRDIYENLEGKYVVRVTVYEFDPEPTVRDIYLHDSHEDADEFFKEHWGQDALIPRLGKGNEVEWEGK